MVKPILIDLFAEDYPHEAFLSEMIGRVASEEGKTIRARPLSARGGHGRALAEFRMYQRAVLKGGQSVNVPDMLVVAIDANCHSWADAKRQIEEEIEAPFKGISVIACPEPHIERWFLADPTSFAEVVGVRPSIGRTKCKRDLYKQILTKAVADAGHPPVLGGVEFAPDIVARMDLYRAGKREKSLKSMVDALRAALKQR